MDLYMQRLFATVESEIKRSSRGTASASDPTSSIDDGIVSSSLRPRADEEEVKDEVNSQVKLPDSTSGASVCRSSARDLLLLLNEISNNYINSLNLPLIASIESDPFFIYALTSMLFSEINGDASLQTSGGLGGSNRASWQSRSYTEEQFTQLYLDFEEQKRLWENKRNLDLMVGERLTAIARSKPSSTASSQSSGKLLNLSTQTVDMNENPFLESSFLKQKIAFNCIETSRNTLGHDSSDSSSSRSYSGVGALSQSAKNEIFATKILPFILVLSSNNDGIFDSLTLHKDITGSNKLDILNSNVSSNSLNKFIDILDSLSDEGFLRKIYPNRQTAITASYRKNTTLNSIKENLSFPITATSYFVLKIEESVYKFIDKMVIDVVKRSTRPPPLSSSDAALLYLDSIVKEKVVTKDEDDWDDWGDGDYSPSVVDSNNDNYNYMSNYNSLDQNNLPSGNFEVATLDNQVVAALRSLESNPSLINKSDIIETLKNNSISSLFLTISCRIEEYKSVWLTTSKEEQTSILSHAYGDSNYLLPPNTPSKCSIHRVMLVPLLHMVLARRLSTGKGRPSILVGGMGLNSDANRGVLGVSSHISNYTDVATRGSKLSMSSLNIFGNSSDGNYSSSSISCSNSNSNSNSNSSSGSASSLTISKIFNDLMLMSLVMRQKLDPFFKLSAQSSGESLKQLYGENSGSPFAYSDRSDDLMQYSDDRSGPIDDATSQYMQSLIEAKRSARVQKDLPSTLVRRKIANKGSCDDDTGSNSKNKNRNNYSSSSSSDNSSNISSSNIKGNLSDNPIIKSSTLTTSSELSNTTAAYNYISNLQYSTSTRDSVTDEIAIPNIDNKTICNNNIHNTDNKSGNSIIDVDSGAVAVPATSNSGSFSYKNFRKNSSSKKKKKKAKRNKKHSKETSTKGRSNDIGDRSDMKDKCEDGESAIEEDSDGEGDENESNSVSEESGDSNSSESDVQSESEQEESFGESKVVNLVNADLLVEKDNFITVQNVRKSTNKTSVDRNNSSAAKSSTHKNGNLNSKISKKIINSSSNPRSKPNFSPNPNPNPTPKISSSEISNTQPGSAALHVPFDQPKKSSSLGPLTLPFNKVVERHSIQKSTTALPPSSGNKTILKSSLQSTFTSTSAQDSTLEDKSNSGSNRIMSDGEIDNQSSNQCHQPALAASPQNVNHNQTFISLDSLSSNINDICNLMDIQMVVHRKVRVALLRKLDALLSANIPILSNAPPSSSSSSASASTTQPSMPSYSSASFKTILYGSSVTGLALPYSDIDIALVPSFQMVIDTRRDPPLTSSSTSSITSPQLPISSVAPVSTHVAACLLASVYTILSAQSQQEYLHNTTLLPHASIPIIKADIDPIKILTAEEYSQISSIATNNSLGVDVSAILNYKIPLDISVLCEGHKGLVVTNFVKNILKSDSSTSTTCELHQKQTQKQCSAESYSESSHPSPILPFLSSPEGFEVDPTLSPPISNYAKDIPVIPHLASVVKTLRALLLSDSSALQRLHLLPQPLPYTMENLTADASTTLPVSLAFPISASNSASNSINSIASFGTNALGKPFLGGLSSYATIVVVIAAYFRLCLFRGVNLKAIIENKSEHSEGYNTKNFDNQGNDISCNSLSSSLAEDISCGELLLASLDVIAMLNHTAFGIDIFNQQSADVFFPLSSEQLKVRGTSCWISNPLQPDLNITRSAFQFANVQMHSRWCVTQLRKSGNFDFNNRRVSINDPSKPGFPMQHQIPMSMSLPSAVQHFNSFVPAHMPFPISLPIQVPVAADYLHYPPSMSVALGFAPMDPHAFASAEVLANPQHGGPEPQLIAHSGHYYGMPMGPMSPFAFPPPFGIGYPMYPPPGHANFNDESNDGSSNESSKDEKDPSNE